MALRACSSAHGCMWFGFSDSECCHVWPFNSHPAYPPNPLTPLPHYHHHPYFILHATANLSTHAHLRPDTDRSQDKGASESVLENHEAPTDPTNQTRHSDVLLLPSQPERSKDYPCARQVKVKRKARGRPYLTKANIQDTEQEFISAEFQHLALVFHSHFPHG